MGYSKEDKVEIEQTISDISLALIIFLRISAHEKKKSTVLYKLKIMVVVLLLKV